MSLKVSWTVNEGVDRRFLFVVLAFGAAAIWGGSYWLSQGEIAIRRGDHDGRRVVATANPGDVVGRIPGDHLLFYPVCITWIGLGVTMSTLTAAALLRGERWLDVLSYWSLALILPLGFLTVLIAVLVKPG